MLKGLNRFNVYKTIDEGLKDSFMVNATTSGKKRGLKFFRFSQTFPVFYRKSMFLSSSSESVVRSTLDSFWTTKLLLQHSKETDLYNSVELSFPSNERCRKKCKIRRKTNLFNNELIGIVLWHVDTGHVVQTIENVLSRFLKNVRLPSCVISRRK